MSAASPGTAGPLFGEVDVVEERGVPGQLVGRPELRRGALVVAVLEGGGTDLERMPRVLELGLGGRGRFGHGRLRLRFGHPRFGHPRVLDPSLLDPRLASRLRGRADRYAEEGQHDQQTSVRPGHGARLAIPHRGRQTDSCTPPW
jgi:hypothetical protein